MAGDRDRADISAGLAGYRLPVIAMGEGDLAPVVFLHGFAGAALSWRHIQPAIATIRPTLAFDLPGHAGAKDFPGFGPPKIAARAIVSELVRRDIPRAHVVGHSMGGAIAALVALTAADRVASLTLLAPGGFGPEIGTIPLRAIVEGDSVEAAAAIGEMGAPGWLPDEETASLYRDIRMQQSPSALAAIFALLFRGDAQGVLPLDALAAMGMPVALIWGEEDRVTPFPQSGFAPAAFSLTALPGIGHMLMEEAPRETIAAILAAIAAADASGH